MANLFDEQLSRQAQPTVYVRSRRVEPGAFGRMLLNVEPAPVKRRNHDRLYAAKRQTMMFTRPASPLGQHCPCGRCYDDRQRVGASANRTRSYRFTAGTRRTKKMARRGR